MTPTVSIVIATYLKDNQAYLDKCLESIKRQVWEGDFSFEVILVSSGEHIPTVPEYITHYHSDVRMHYPEAINHGVKLTNPESRYLMLLNDDTILARHTLATMAYKCSVGPVILNAMSNCDNGWMYNARIVLKNGIDEMHLSKRFYTLHELDRFHEAIMHHPRGADILLRVPYVCFYGTMMPRYVWNSVGGLDPKFKTGHDDEDFCMRAARLSISSFIDLESFIFHFGGVSANAVITDAEREENKEYFKSKWGSA